MFQSFESRSSPATVASRIALLRKIMAGIGIDGFLVPRSDEHQGEYVASCSERLAWLTSFTGSAGTALVLMDTAHLFVDGRYTVQAGGQTDTGIFAIEDLVNNPPSKWLKSNPAGKMRIAYDPWLHTVDQADKLRKILEARGGILIALENNPIDQIWTDRPNPPLEPVVIHPVEYAGKPAHEKLSELSNTIAGAGAGGFVATDPATIAWAFNIRGADVPHTPLALGFALFGAEGAPILFMDKRKMPMETEAYLTQLATLRPPSSFGDHLSGIAKGDVLALDTSLAADEIRNLIASAGGTVKPMADPAALARAVKNDAEIRGTRAAHLRDAAAVIRFLAWLDSKAPGELDEISAAEHLEEIRVATGEDFQMPLRDLSFETISGFGPNGAVVHYRVSTETNRAFEAGNLYLVDSGGQYEDGTTDITRTIPIGVPPREMQERYTLVLKGLIGISTLRFPPGTRGQDIDAIARIALWKSGLDYAHGTGHGVGSYLSVHEGPQRIARTGTEPLLAGMILSNEPGYYRAGAYGIRLENLVLVTPAGDTDGGDLPMHGFETLTLVPFDRRMILTDLLTREELSWLNRFHDRIRKSVLPLLNKSDTAWLKAATAALR